MRRDLQLLHDVHEVNMMMSLDHLMHLLGGTHDAENLQIRQEHFSSIHNQILKLFLHVVEEEAADLVGENVYCHVLFGFGYMLLLMIY